MVPSPVSLSAEVLWLLYHCEKQYHTFHGVTAEHGRERIITRYRDRGPSASNARCRPPFVVEVLYISLLTTLWFEPNFLHDLMCSGSAS